MNHTFKTGSLSLIINKNNCHCRKKFPLNRVKHISTITKALRNDGRLRTTCTFQKEQTSIQSKLRIIIIIIIIIIINNNNNNNKRLFTILKEVIPFLSFFITWEFLWKRPPLTAIFKFYSTLIIKLSFCMKQIK